MKQMQIAIVLACLAAFVTATPWGDMRQTEVEEEDLSSIENALMQYHYWEDNVMDQSSLDEEAHKYVCEKAPQLPPCKPHLQEALQLMKAKTSEVAETQQRTRISAGTTVQNCGRPGAIVHSVIRAAVDWLLIFNPNAYGVSIDCGVGGPRAGCTSVIVDAPVGTRHANVNVCNRNGNVCVIVEAAPSCRGIFPILVPIQLPVSGVGTVPATLEVSIGLGPSCVNVRLNAPAC